MKVEKKNYGGVKAAQSESYSLSKEFMEIYQKADVPWWGKPMVILVLTIVFSIMDALVLYSVLDKAMLQSKAMGIIMAWGIAVVLNVIPLLVAKFIHEAIHKTKRYALTLAMIAIVAFFVLFGGTCYLRFAYSDSYGSSSSTQLINTVSNNEEEHERNSENGKKGVAVVVLLCLEPLVTSIVNFGLAYIGDDELKKKIQKLEIREVELREIISDLQAAIATMDTNMERVCELDEQAMVAAVAEVEARCDILRAIARNLLAEHLANPSATTKLSHEMLLKDAG